MARARSWCWTLPNYTEPEIEKIQVWVTKYAKYCVYGEEVSPTTNTPHLQGYMTLLDARTRSALKKALGRRIHLEVAKGTAAQNTAYCVKDGKVWTHGNEPRQGTRTDLELIRTTCREGGMRAVVEIGNLQQIRVAEKVLQYTENVRNFKTKIIWIYGESGTGKSYAASKAAKRLYGDDVYYKAPNKWWCGYDAHKAIVIDDWRSGWWSLSYMLQLMDEHPMRIEPKNGARQMLAERIYITTIEPPTEFYRAPNAEGVYEPQKQLLRRLHRVYKVTLVDGKRHFENCTEEITQKSG